MRNQLWTRVAGVSLGFLAFLLMGAAQADPPARVGRLSYVSGAASFSPAGEDEWFMARINRPIITGDRLWADSDALVELQVGRASVRLASNTSVTTLNLDDRVAQFQLAQGTLDVRVRRLGQDEVFEVDTPNLAFSARRPGHYRIDVAADGRATSISVRSGSAEVFGEGVAYTLDAGQWYRFYGTRLEQSEVGALPPPDSFDRWSDARDRRYAGSASARYVAPEIIGYEDLDEHGTWRVVGEYGNVWVPRSVPTGWAPYRYGHWAWIEPWGWTWVDDAPWGFAPFHYGRWTIIGGAWGWVPGPVSVHPVYAPALVAFIGGSNFRLSLTIGAAAGIAWFPLAPGEVYRPAYPVSRTYFTNVNVSNTTINNTYVTNIYNNPSSVTQIRYANQQVAAAVTAVPTAAFVQSQPVARAAITVSRDTLAKAPITEAAPVAPSRASVTGAAPAATSKPSAAVLTRPAVAKVEPPPRPVSFAAKQSALAANPGRPLAESDKSAVKAQPTREAPRVTVVKPSAPQPAPKGGAPADAQRRAPAPSVAQPGATAPEAPRAPAPSGAPQPPASVEKAQPPSRERREPQPPQPGMTRPEERAQPPAGPKAEPTPGARPPETRMEEQRRARQAPRPPESGREETGARPAPTPRPPDAARDEPRRTPPAPRPAETRREESRGTPPAARPPEPRKEEQRATPTTPPAARPPEERRETQRAAPPAPRPAETRREESRGAPPAARPPEPRKEEQRAAPITPPAARQPDSRREDQPRTTPDAPPSTRPGKAPERTGERQKREEDEKKQKKEE